MAMQTPVLSISIQEMCLSDVITMSRRKKFENFIYHITYKSLCHLRHAALVLVLQLSHKHSTTDDLLNQDKSFKTLQFTSIILLKCMQIDPFM